MKRKEEVSSLKGMSAQALKEKVDTLEHELMNLRFRKSSGQLTHSAQLKTLRRSVARAKTFMQQQAKH